jgi:YbbR domain-containing protein
MDKWMDNPWFIKIIALLLAILLYSSVPHTSSKINVPGDQMTAAITNVPVKAYYDTENLVVAGIPDSVEVTIKGPIPHVQSAKTLRNFEVYVDLTKAKIGNQRIKLRIKDLSDKLKVTIDPSYVNVSVQEKVTKDFKVDAEFNSDLLQAGYVTGEPIVEPNSVKITGARNVIDQIAFVKATLDIDQGITSDFTRDARIQVLDRNLNKLNVNVEPDTVRVTVPVTDISKKVPIDIIQKGTPPKGVSIDSITLDTPEATIIGSQGALKNTDHVRVEVDVSKIGDNTTLTLPVIISNGITKVTPQVVKAKVVVNKQDETTISDMPVQIHGLSANYKAEVNTPTNGSVNIFVNGPSSSIKKLKSKDFSVFIDVTQLKEGDHDVEIHVEGPPDVNWKLDKSTANITIAKNNA